MRRYFTPKTMAPSVALMLIAHIPLHQVSAAQPDRLPVSQMIELIQSEISRATLARDKQTIPFEITSVDVVLTGTATTQGEFGVAVEIPIVEKIAGVWANTGGKIANTQRIRLTLVPEKGAVPVAGATDLGLLPAIVSVKFALQAAATNDFPLRLESFSFEVEFAVTKTIEGGFRFVFIDVANVGYDEIAIQRITIHMAPAE